MNPFGHDPTSFHYPLPEAIHEGQWDIKHGPPGVSIEHRLLSVPLDDSQRSFHIRRHEIGRAHWFPNDVVPMSHAIGCSPRTLLGVQDAAINQCHSNNEEIGRPRYTSNRDDLKLLARRISSIPDLRNRMLGAISMVFTHEYDQIYSAMDPRERSVLDQVEYMLANPFPKPNQEAVESTCLWLEAMFESSDKGHFSEGTLSMMDLNRISKENDANTKRGDAKRGESTKNWFGNQPRKREGAGRWFEHQWWYPPLSQRLPGHKMGRKKYSQVYGAVPRKMYRWAIDGQIFERVIKGPGGGILIDASGSMQFTSHQVYTIMTYVPNCSVAMYMGGAAPGCSKKGHIVLLADKGRCVTEEGLVEHRFGGDNAVDGPALRWLATVRGPKVWVSDGYVTGVGGCMTELLYECAAICADANIKRIATIKDALAFFKAGCRTTNNVSYRDAAPYSHEDVGYVITDDDCEEDDY